MYIALKKQIKDEHGDVFLYVSVAAKESDKMKKLFESISNKGINYFLAIHNKSNLNNPVYMNLCLENMRKATAAILVVDDTTLANKAYFNMLNYEAGYIIGQSKTLMLLNNDISQEMMNEVYIKSPINNVQISSLSQVMDVVDKYQFLPKALFDDEELNNFSRKRIFYISMFVMMDIRLGTVKKIMDRLNMIMDDELTINDTLRFIEDSVSTGLTVLNFGDKKQLGQVGFWPYQNEAVILEKDYPVRSILNQIKIFTSNREHVDELNDVLATMKMEFIVPNNEVLGVSFKPFFHISNNSIMPNDVVQILLDDNIDKDSIKTVRDPKGYRIYYSMNADDGKMITTIDERLEEKYAKTCNYIYPK